MRGCVPACFALKLVSMCRPKIVEGRLAKIRSQKALLEQPYIKDTGSTVAEHIKSAVASLGENIQVCALSCHYLGIPCCKSGRRPNVTFVEKT